MDIPLELFLTGVSLGFGPCLFFCVPIIIPYIAGTSKNWMEGLKAILAFSLSRFSGYALLGLAAGLSGQVLVEFLGQTNFSLYVWIMGGLFISALGCLILFGVEPKVSFFRSFSRTIDGGLVSLALLGFLVGITPCAPLIGVLTYIALNVESPLAGALHSMCFGLGAAIVTPITVLGIVAGGAPRLIFKTPRIYDVFKRSCGAMLILMGVRQVASQFTGMMRYW